MCKSLHESFGSWFGDGSEVSDEFLFGHTDSCVSEGEGVGGLVWDDLYFEGWLVFGDVWVSEWFVSNFIKGVWGIGDEFSQEDFFVGVESVDDQPHELLDISIEGKMLSRLCLAHISRYYIRIYVEVQIYSHKSF